MVSGVVHLPTSGVETHEYFCFGGLEYFGVGEIAGMGFTEKKTEY
jgi:hypothetical protein